jgi:cytochrome c peroxidase
VPEGDPRELHRADEPRVHARADQEGLVLTGNSDPLWGAFPKENPRNGTTLTSVFQREIAAFERTLACGSSRFDAFVHGNNRALNASEQRGLQLFVDKANCVTCHSGPFLSDQSFHNVGVEQRTTREGITNTGDRGAAADLALAKVDPLSVEGIFSDGDDGRLPATVTAMHEGAFRTPTLRCVGHRPTYFHTGLAASLDTVIAHFDRGGDPGGFPGTSELRPLGLSRDERGDLKAFLLSLTP